MGISSVRRRFYGSTIDRFRPNLALVATSVDEPSSFEPPPFSLRSQPQRPGELAELLQVSVEPTEAELVREKAAAAGLPVELALYITIEGERAVAEAAAVMAVAPTELAEFLDQSAAVTPARGPRNLLVRPLEQYAVAITGAPPCSGQGSGLLAVRVPHRVAAAWAHAAASAGLPFERWLADAVVGASALRVTWEAAAARTGRSLAEWVLLQAARCARSRSTSPQTTASG